MAEYIKDPIIEVLRYSRIMSTIHGLADVEACIFAAAFVLYTDFNYLELGNEAAYYLAESSGDYLNTIVTAHKRRMANGTLGSMETTVEAAKPDVL